MPSKRQIFDGIRWREFGSEAPLFIPGTTMPIYVSNVDVNQAVKNIGNIPGVTLIPYANGAPGNGSTVQVTAPTTFNNIDFGDRLLDIRAACTFNNCRGTLTTSNFSSGLTSMVTAGLNGGGATLITFNDSEFHVRCQRIMNVMVGRNLVLNRCVLTGGVDCCGNGSGGSGPQSPGTISINDSWLGELAWWYHPTPGTVHTNDTATHNDCSQLAAAYGMSWTNTFFGAWPSPYVGTGTPNCGSPNNPLVANYITTQTQMEAWRASVGESYTRADQSFMGISRRCTQGAGGSWAALMGTAKNGTAFHCYFSGGGTQINLSNTSAMTNPSQWSVKQSIMWNDMYLGHSLTSTAKGTSIYARSSVTFDIPVTGDDRNLWFDGTTVQLVGAP